MLRKSETGKNAPSFLDSGNGVRLLHDIEALSKALSIKTKTPRALPPPPDPNRRPRSVSAGKSDFSDSRSKPRRDVAPPAPPPRVDKKLVSTSSSSSSSSSIWSWKTLKALSHIGHRRFDCRFTLHVHSVEGLPPVFNDSSLFVNWKRVGGGGGGGGADGVRTSPARVFQGVAEFEEVLANRCAVYGSRSGQNNSAKYESRQFVLSISVLRNLDIDLGKHRVDLTRLLPLTFEELEEEASTGKWSTTFKLSGKGRGAVLNVSFGYSLVKDGVEKIGGSRKGSSYLEGSVGKVGRRNNDGQGSQRWMGGDLGQNRVLRDRSLRSSRSVEDVKVLHEILPTTTGTKSSGVDGGEQLLVPEKCEEVGTDAFDCDLKPQLEVFTMQDHLIELEVSPMPNQLEVDNKKEIDVEVPGLVVGAERGIFAVEQEPVKEKEEECDDPDFTVIEQGVEMLDKCLMVGDYEVNLMHEDESTKTGKMALGEVEEEQIPQGKVPLVSDVVSMENKMLVNESVIEESDTTTTTINSLAIPENVNFESPLSKEEIPDLLDYAEAKSNYKIGKRSKSLSLDDVEESVASEFLSMLGIEHSPFGTSSESEPESPRERLLKEFEKESLNIIESPREHLLKEFEKEFIANKDSVFGPKLGNIGESVWEEDIDLSSIVLAAETEHHKATQTMKSKTRAKLLEDAETEALMREWGLNEKTFHCSPPPGSRSGFGSPIDLPPEEPLDLPPLAEGLGSFVQMKDGGFLRSMSPSLFKSAKNNGSLVMQVSSPVVMPAEMGSGIMDILQRLASIGIEKLSVQASKLMPLEDITGKTMQQVAWETLPALDANDRQDFEQAMMSQVEAGPDGNYFGGRKKGKNLNLSSSRAREASSEYVSLEDLAPLAMDKIEALSIEGLRIQSSMSDDDAPSNINPQLIGNMSALEGKVAMSDGSLGLEGAAGLQLLDVKDGGEDVDGLMGLSLTLDEWMKLDSGIVDEDDLNSERTSKILAAHHANSADLISGGWKGDKRGGKGSGRRWGLLGNNFTVALMVQLRDPMRNYEPVGTPMLSLIQVERVFMPPKPKVYRTVFGRGLNEEDNDPEKKPESVKEEEKKEEEVQEATPHPQFKITEVHIAGLKTEPGKKKLWGNSSQQQSGSRWLLANGMGKSNKHPFLKSKPVSKSSQSTTTVRPGDTLWSISSRVHGTGEKWKDLAALNPHIRNPNVIFPNETIRLH